MGVSQLQPDLTFGQVPLRIQELLGDLCDLFLGSSPEVLQSVHQRSLAPKTVNFPMKAGIPLYHEGFVHRTPAVLPLPTLSTWPASCGRDSWPSSPRILGWTESRVPYCWSQRPSYNPAHT